MTDKWYNVDYHFISQFMGNKAFYTCYICKKDLRIKENPNHFFHNDCYGLLLDYITEKVYIKDISNIIIGKIR